MHKCACTCTLQLWHLLIAMLLRNLEAINSQMSVQGTIDLNLPEARRLMWGLSRRDVDRCGPSYDGIRCCAE